MEAELAEVTDGLRQGHQRRILVIGSPGSGKSTVARALGKQAALPVVHADRLWFEANNPDWKYRPAEATLADVRRALREARWVFDGNHVRTGPEAAANCTMLVHLELPRALCAWRAYWRYQTYTGGGRPDLPEGCHESFDLKFYEYIMFGWREEHAEFIRQVRSKARTVGATVVTLRTAAELDMFLSMVRGESGPAESPSQAVPHGPWRLGVFAAHKLGVFSPRPANSRPQDYFDEEELARIRLRNQVAFANSMDHNPCASVIDELPDVWPAQPVWSPPPAAVCEATSLTLVDSADKVNAMMNVLDLVDVFGLDIEHYQQRSFYGLICTLQVSTVADGNFLIDALDPEVRRAIREQFQRVASNPKIIKVMHLDKNDTTWLQKDFGIFLVNVFDTGEAAAQVGLPLNFGDLLLAVAGVRLDKGCRTTDWTRRPISVDLAYYAVADAHYLLPVAADLWGRLLELDDGTEGQPRLRSVCKAGKKACLPVMQLRVPAVPTRDNTGTQPKPWSNDINFKNKLKLWQDRAPRDDRCIADLYLWRDNRCRALDEGVHHVCRTELLLELARQRPDTAEDVAGVLGPGYEGNLGIATELAQLIAQSVMEPQQVAVRQQLSDQPAVEAAYSAAHCLIFNRDNMVAVVKSQKGNQVNPKYNDVGGKREPTESDPWQTLLREAEEETGWVLTDISSFQVICSQFIPAAKSVAYLIVARNQTMPQPQPGDAVRAVLLLGLEEAESKLNYRGRQCLFAFREQVRWRHEFDEESFWQVPVLSRLEASAMSAQGSDDANEDPLQRGQTAPTAVAVPPLHYRYSKPGICLLAAKPLLIDAGWEAHGTIKLQAKSLHKLADLANLLFKAVHGRSATVGNQGRLRLIGSVLVLPEWPSNAHFGGDPDEAAMTLFQRSTLKQIGFPNASFRSCESVLVQSIYGDQWMYISRQALEPGSAHSLKFRHDTQGLISHAEYVEQQYRCSVSPQDRALEVETLPLVDGKPQARDNKLVAGWTILFPNISRACVVAAGSAYQSLGFEQQRKNKHFTLWVGNISSITTSRQLRETFPDAVYAHVVKDRGRYLHGFVDFTSESDAQHVLNAPAQQLNGRTLRVEWPVRRGKHCNHTTEADRVCCTALFMGLSLGDSGITIADMRSALQDKGYGSHEQLELESGRWGKLGDAVVELFARHSINKVDPGQLGVPCSSCMNVHHLVGLATQLEAVPGGCPYCHIQRLVSNDRLSSVYDSWIRCDRDYPSHSVTKNGTLDDHTKGDCVEACIAVVAYRCSLGLACKIFASVTDPLCDRASNFFPSQSATATSAVELDDILLKEFGPADSMSCGATAEATWQWTKCVLLGEAVTNLCVLLFHFRKHPDASKDELHRLQRTEPYASVKSSSLAAAAERGGVMNWLAPAMDRYATANDDHALTSVQSECWKAAIGVLLLNYGGMDDDGSWDTQGVIHRWLLQADKLPPLLRPNLVAMEPEAWPESTSNLAAETDPEPELDLYPAQERQWGSEPELLPQKKLGSNLSVSPEPDSDAERAVDIPPSEHDRGLQDFLVELNLQRYENKLAQFGVVSLERLAALSKDDLESMGIAKGPRVKIAEMIAPWQRQQLPRTQPRQQQHKDARSTSPEPGDFFELQRRASRNEHSVSSEPAQEGSLLAQIFCVCKNCGNFLCRADSLQLERHEWPPLLRMPHPTLRLGDHSDEKMRKKFDKAICIGCGKDVGPVEKATRFALLKAQKKPKVVFKRENGETLTAQEFLAIYVSERPQ